MDQAWWHKAVETNQQNCSFLLLSLGSHCHFHCLHSYVSKLTQAALEKDIFYSKPTQDDGLVLYIPLGHNTLEKKIKEIFTLAHLSVDSKSNHSLCATAFSSMYRAEVPGKMIMERSGHLSKDSYERTSSEQVKSICKIFAVSKAISFLSKKLTLSSRSEE